MNYFGDLSKRWEMPQWMERFCENTFRTPKHNVERLVNLRTLVRSDDGDLPREYTDVLQKVTLLNHLYLAGFIEEENV